VYEPAPTVRDVSQIRPPAPPPEPPLHPPEPPPATINISTRPPVLTVNVPDEVKACIVYPSNVVTVPPVAAKGGSYTGVHTEPLDTFKIELEVL
jgi:hypothetical protein